MNGMLTYAESGIRPGAGDPHIGVNATWSRRVSLGPNPTANLAGTSREARRQSLWDRSAPPRKIDHGGSCLVTEFEIRRELATIESLRLDGITKARRLLKIAKRVRAGALTLAHLSLRKLQDGDGESAARFRAAARRLVDLHDEIRGTAKTTLTSASEPTDMAEQDLSTPELREEARVLMEVMA